MKSKFFEYANEIGDIRGKMEIWMRSVQKNLGNIKEELGVDFIETEPGFIIQLPECYKPGWEKYGILGQDVVRYYPPLMKFGRSKDNIGRMKGEGIDFSKRLKTTVSEIMHNPDVLFLGSYRIELDKGIETKLVSIVGARELSEGFLPYGDIKEVIEHYRMAPELLRATNILIQEYANKFDKKFHI